MSHPAIKVWGLRFLGTAVLSASPSWVPSATRGPRRASAGVAAPVGFVTAAPACVPL